MPIVRIEHAVPSYEGWKQAFDLDPADRKGSGVRRYRILRSQNNPNMVMIDLEFDRLPDAEDFLRTMERLWEGPAKSVVQGPRGRIVDLVEEREV